MASTAVFHETYPPPVPELPEAKFEHESWNDWLMTGFSRIIDATMLRGMSLVVDSVLLPDPAEIPAMRAAARDIIESDHWLSPRGFFPFIDNDDRPALVESTQRRRLDGGEVVTREFLTEYEPAHEPGHFEPGCEDSVLVEHWIHTAQTPRATVVALHGFTMGYPRFDGFALFANDLFACGLDVALVTLPAHGARTPSGARFSGEKFAMPRIDQLNEVVRQAVYEVHTVSNWLRDHSGAPVGLLGLSLGGYLSALLAGLRDDWQFVVPIVPPACIGDLAFRFRERSHSASAEEQLAFERDELRAAYRVHSPLAHPLRVPKDNILIVAGKGDLIVPPEHPQALWEHWGGPDIHWFSGSHVAPLPRRSIARRIVEHVCSTVQS